MKLPIIICGLMLHSAFYFGQEEKKQTRVHIQKVETINGETKITDTTYTTDNPAAIDLKMPDVPEISMDGKSIKIVALDEMSTEDKKEFHDKMKSGSTISITEDDMAGKKVMIKKVSCGASAEEIANAPVFDEVVIIRKVNVTDLSEKDRKMLEGKPALSTDGKLLAEDILFSPNPNDGKFKLSFSLKKQGDTEVSILNSEGVTVYTESLKNFSGKYNKEIDISNQPKGIYFARISQGKHSQLKKIVVE